MFRKQRCKLLNHLYEMDLLMHSPDILNLTEIIRSRFYFAVINPDSHFKNTGDTLFFNVDDEYTYINFYYDFGPLNLSCLYKYCTKVTEYLQSGDYKRVVHCTSSDPQSKANAAFLIGSFAVIYLRVNPQEITRALVSGCVHFMPFADASQGGSDWKITLLDCFSAVQRAHSLGFYKFSDFDVNEYDKYDKLQNGDINWILPRKFLAFIGPTDLEITNYHSPEFYIQYFVSNDVKAVIRLNNNTYDPSTFTSVGIEHYDLFFPDGTTPPKNILVEFLKIAESTSGPLAVHCKAGLGRTGSLIGAYMLKHYRIRAREAIAWLRICRPGSVIGQQQGWLESMEGWLWRQGNHYRYTHYGDINKIPHHKYGIYSEQWNKERGKLKNKTKQKELESCSSKNSHASRKCSSMKSSVMSDCKNSSYETWTPNVIGTQGDKLNFIKMLKQNAGSSTRGSSKSRKPSVETKTHHRKK